MLRQERHDLILQKLQNSKKVVSSELSLELHVSEDTIRRDLRELSKSGQILKVHGGALATSHHLFHYQKEEILDYDLKNIVAHKAIDLIKQQSVILMSGGTTNLVLARCIPDEITATVYTYSLPIAMQLTEHPNIELIFIGGKMHKSAQVTIGMDVISSINEIRADYCFMGVSGLDFKAGLTEIDWEVAHIKKAMISISEKTILLSTSSKIGTAQRYLVENTENIHGLITELDPEDDRVREFNKKGVLIY